MKSCSLGVVLVTYSVHFVCLSARAVRGRLCFSTCFLTFMCLLQLVVKCVVDSCIIIF